MMEHVRPGHFRPRLHRVVFVLFLVGLLFFTAWNLTRSDAILDARRAYSKLNLPVALERALDHLNRQPWSREGALLAANCLSRLDYVAEAERYYLRAGRLAPGDLQIRAYALARGPHPELAVLAYKEILARSPENVTAMRRLAAVLLAQNQSNELLELAERLDRIPSGAVIGSTLRGVVYHNDENPQQAVAAFERVLELDPSLREMPLPHNLFWTHLADDLATSGRLADARGYLAKAIQDAPDPLLLNRLGTMYFLQGALDDAERCFRQAVSLAANDYAAYTNLAKLAILRNDKQEALTQLNHARALSPRRYDVLYNLASVYRQLGRTQEADQIEVTLKQLREHSVPEARTSTGTWPKYSL